MREDFDALFYPRSVAVIGASDSPQKLSYYPIRNLIEGGFSGRIYPVNPRLNEISGLKAYPSVKAIPAGVDMAIIVVPAHLVPSALKECAQKGVRGTVIITAGFKEWNTEQGARLQEEITAIANEAKIKMIGPNVLGLINPYAKLNATFHSTFKDASKGNIAIVSQSGGICSFLLHAMINQNLGISLAMSLGNRGNVDFVDLVAYLGEHPQTKVIALYIEGIDNPHRLIEAAKGVVDKKPIVAYKAGGESLNQVAYSHTGSLAGKYEAYHAAFRQAGIIAVDDLTELMDVSKALAFQPPPAGNKVAIFSLQAGAGIIMAHACQRCGLALAHYSPQAKRGLRELAKTPFLNENPLDVAPFWGTDADDQIYDKILRIILGEEGVDAILISTTYFILDAPLIASLISLGEKKALIKPVILCRDSPKGITDQEIAKLEKLSIPVYPFPERAVKALAGLVRYGKARYLTS